MRLGLVCAAYPPDLDGIGDYTWWMARTLAVREDVEKPVKVFTRIGSDHVSSVGVELVRFFDPRHPASFSSLLDASAEIRNNWLVLQYNPFSWGVRGYCPWVPSTLRKLRERNDGTRLAVMFHETAVPKWPLGCAVMFAWQYPILGSMCRLADVAFVSTTRWTAQVQRAARRLPVHHLPVGSNVPLCDVSREEARAKLGIDRDWLVLGVFGGANIGRRLDWIAAVLAEVRRRRGGRTTTLLYVGPDGEAMRRALGIADLIDCGALPATEVGVRLRAMDAAISPFLDGISTRRGSVIALLQHGIPIATNQDSLTDELFRAAALKGLLVSTAKSSDTFAAETADWLERLPIAGVPDPELTSFHDRVFAWQAIADTMVRYLR